MIQPIVVIGRGIPYRQKAVQFLPGTHKDIYEFLMQHPNTFRVAATENRIDIMFKKGNRILVTHWDWILIETDSESGKDYIVDEVLSDELMNLCYQTDD